LAAAKTLGIIGEKFYTPFLFPRLICITNVVH
jgi:hypothetical protein